MSRAYGKILTIITAVFASLTPIYASEGGSTVEGGGDAVTCVPSSVSPLSGVYSFDYLMTMDDATGASDDIAGASWEEIQQRVQSFLVENLPEASKKFARYNQLLFTNHPEQERQWVGSDHGIADLPDEAIVKLLPENCLHRDPLGKLMPNLTQLVRRREITTEFDQRVIYEYDRSSLQLMREKTPLQFSYLVVHEWLWDYTLSPWMNRAINRLLHSKTVHGMSRDAFLAYVKSIGIEISPGGGLLPRELAKNPLQQVFAANPTCDINRRVIAEFAAPSSIQHFSMAPGERVRLALQIPENAVDPLEWRQSCGFALVLNPAAMFPASKISMTLSRGNVPYETTLDIGDPDNAKTTFLHGQCLDSLCLHRTGTLVRMFTPEKINLTQYDLVVTNVSENMVHLQMPYLLFVGTK